MSLELLVSGFRALSLILVRPRALCPLGNNVFLLHKSLVKIPSGRDAGEG